MKPGEIRSHRLNELQRLVNKLHNDGKPSSEILKAITKRAKEMAGSSTAREYIEEIIVRNSK